MLTEKIFAIAHLADQVVLWILLVLSVVSIAIILERFFVLGKISSESNRIRSRIRMALQSNSIEDVEDIAKDVNCLEGKIANYALKHIKTSGSKGLEELFNSFVLSERPELERSLGFLATIGSNAPYIGLLGTVLGIMKAFNDLSQSTAAGQQTVMAGISMALVATAAGLFVAIPAVISYNYYNKKVRGIIQNLENIKEISLVYAKKQGI